jgi:hypothetical protein
MARRGNSRTDRPSRQITQGSTATTDKDFSPERERDGNERRIHQPRVFLPIYFSADINPAIARIAAPLNSKRKRKLTKRRNQFALIVPFRRRNQYHLRLPFHFANEAKFHSVYRSVSTKRNGITGKRVPLTGLLMTDSYGVIFFLN